MVRPVPVGIPALVVLMVGFAAFLIALLAARRRRARGGPEQVARQSPASWGAIALQGAGIFIAGSGMVVPTLDPASPRALVTALIVAVLMAGATWLFDASSRAMGANWSLVARTRDDHALVRHGPFAYVRHPIYVALFLLLLAVAIAEGHLANLLLAVPVYALGTRLRIGHEERLLRDAFGTAYDDYARAVKRFVPGVY